MACVPFLLGMTTTPELEDLLVHFDRVAFGNEYTGERFPRVRKWKNPLRIGIQGDAPDFLDAEIRQHVGELHRLTRHPIDLVYSAGMRRAGMVAPGFNTRDLNVIVYFVPREKIEPSIRHYFDNDSSQVARMMATATCFAKFFKKKDEIRAAIVVIPANLSREVIRACVVEELTQIMGLPNDSDHIDQSVFNDKSRFNELTRYDRMLVRLLYDERLASGTPRPEALALARITLGRFLTQDLE
ncbi:MAG: DUF2927 domain-containing protein [Magnetococcales bacterium]|nr:DUF2927 domain-containing protein [Magnetococcales bacterium]